MRQVILSLAAGLALLAPACANGDGTGSGPPEGVDRTIDIDMLDTRFDPDELSVGVGETIQFRFHNEGVVMHDAFIGDEDEQVAHGDEMRSEDMEHGAHGGESEGITVQPGQTGTLTHTFDEPGEFEIGCHQPGHYEVGMIVAITVQDQ